jgi:RNA polymerase sigma factor (TIGR02999 family)
MTAGITQLLEQAAAGDCAAGAKILEALYTELHRLVAQAMRHERVNHTLQPTALVNEAYVRLLGNGAVTWECRAHFLNTAARVMRRILIDHARKATAQKRPGAGQRVEMEDRFHLDAGDPDLVLTIDEALTRLEALDPRQARIVQLRYFGGLSVEETAQVIGVSSKTIKREWAMARAWLESELRSQP